jgi:V/A-type H+-transporting ATPase subunit E
MTEDIKSLIEKINQEGVEAAEAKAGEIQQQAERQAEEILTRARKEAERLLAEAAEKIKTMEERQRQLLTQAGRDFLLSLRAEISAAIERIILQDVRQALALSELNKILAEVIRNYSAKEKGDIVISLKPRDAEELERHYLAKLKEETKKGITLKPSGEISGGFTISFDAGRSQFDFTDSALAEYVGKYLKPQLSQILKQAAEQ